MRLLEAMHVCYILLKENAQQQGGLDDWHFSRRIHILKVKKEKNIGNSNKISTNDGVE